MKIVKVEFKYRIVGVVEPVTIICDVEVESDSNEKEMEQQVSEYYYKEIISYVTRECSETYKPIIITK